MKIINLLINESVLKAELSLERATSGNIVELCQNYLLLLTEYRDQLLELRGLPEINLQITTAFARELVQQSRNAVRKAVEITVRERNRTEALLNSFTTINVHDAAETFNRLRYLGAVNWETGPGGVRFSGDEEPVQMTVREAVEMAGRLRREAYVKDRSSLVEQTAAAKN
jgi:hypothetical protein